MKKSRDISRIAKIFAFFIFPILGQTLSLAAQEIPQAQPLIIRRSVPEIFVIIISLALFWLFAGGALVVLLMKIKDSDRLFRLSRKERSGP